MIFETLILAILLASGILFVTFLLVEYLMEGKHCSHQNWAEYQSRKVKQCIDCGAIEKMETHL